MKKVGILWHPKAFEIDTAVYDGKDINTYTGHNTGNMAYVEGIKNIVQASSYQFLPWSVKEKDIPSDIELLIFPAANQLGAHTDLDGLADTFLGYGRPLVAIGLGAQFKKASDEIVLKEGTRRWLDVLCSLAPKKGVPNIITRGDFTASVLDRLGYKNAYVSAGCPSQFINLNPALYSTIAEHVAASDLYSLSYNTSHYAWAWAKEFDRAAFDYVRLNAGSMIVQAPGEFIELVKSRTEKHLNPKFALAKNYYDDSVDDATFVRLMKEYFFTFSSASAWRTWLAHYDFNFGTRIHGTMLSLQTEVPSFLIVHDTRTTELAEKIGVPHLHVNDMPKDRNLVSFVKDFLKSYNFEYTDWKRRSNALVYENFFEGNGVPMSEKFEAFVKSTPRGGKEVSSKLSLPVSSLISRVISKGARVLEVFESLSAIHASKKSMYSYFGFKRRELKAKFSAALSSLPIVDTLVFSSAFDQIADLSFTCESLNWNFRQLIVKADAKWADYFHGDFSVDTIGLNQINQQAAFLDKLKENGFYLKVDVDFPVVSDPDSNGRVVMSFMK